jgi:hypothetical protein
MIMGDSKYRIFISHRPEDRNTANAVSGVLRLFGDGKLEPLVGYDIPGGREWRDWISEKIEVSDIMLFLYTEENVDWMWSFYEIGLFRGPSALHPRPIICIRNPSIKDLPSPIEQYQAYDATEDGIKKFLEDLLYRGEFTNQDRINEKLFVDDNYALAVQDLLSAFELRASTEVIFNVQQFSIDLMDQDNGRNEIDIDDAIIVGNPVIMDIFGVHDVFVHFKKLYEIFKKQNNAKWLEQLRSSIEELRDGNLPLSYFPPFATRDGRKFQPILSQFERIPRPHIDKPPMIKKLHIMLILRSPEDSLLSERLSDQSSMIVNPIFSPIKESINSKLVFSLMPFKKEKNLQDVYENHTKAIVESFGLNCLRADDIFKHHMIMEDIWENICTTRFVISDLTDKNPNVFYELGMAHTVGKRVVLITQNEEDIPFDLRHLRYIKYEYTPSGMKKFEDELKKAIDSILKAT